MAITAKIILDIKKDKQLFKKKGKILILFFFIFIVKQANIIKLAMIKGNINNNSSINKITSY